MSDPKNKSIDELLADIAGEDANTEDKSAAASKPTTKAEAVAEAEATKTQTSRPRSQRNTGNGGADMPGNMNNDGDAPNHAGDNGHGGVTGNDGATNNGTQLDPPVDKREPGKETDAKTPVKEVEVDVVDGLAPDAATEATKAVPVEEAEANAKAPGAKEKAADAVKRSSRRAATAAVAKAEENKPDVDDDDFGDVSPQTRAEMQAGRERHLRTQRHNDE